MNSRVNVPGRPIHDKLPAIFQVARRGTGVHLAIVNSMNTDCEMVSINGKDYLIYDLQVSKNFDLMNRILYHKGRVDLAHNFIIRFIARVQFNLDQILPCGYLTMFTEGKYKPEVTGVEDNFGDLLHRQEFFVILHELEHHRLGMMEREAHKALIEKARAEYLKRFKYIEVKSIRWDQTSELSEEVQEGLKNLEKYAREQLSGLTVTESVEEFKRHALENVLTNDEFIEELLCDREAYFKFMQVANIENKVEAISIGAYSALVNLRALSEITHFSLKNESEHYNQVNQYYDEANLRMIFFERTMFQHVGDLLDEASYDAFFHHVKHYKEKVLTAFTNPIYMKLPSWWKLVKQKFPDMFSKELNFIEKQETKADILKFFR